MHKNIDCALIFAAGFGTRMRPLTNKIPKPLVRIGQFTLLDIAIKKLYNANIKNIYVNTHYKAEMIHNHLKQYDNITIIHETEILETGGGLLNLVNQINCQTCITYNVDVIWQENDQKPYISKMQDTWYNSDLDLLMLAHNIKDFPGYKGPGDFTLTKNLTLVAGEYNQHVYMGTQIINTNLLRRMKRVKFSLSKLYKGITDKESGIMQKASAVNHNGSVIHIGDMNTLKIANHIIKAQGIESFI